MTVRTELILFIVSIISSATGAMIFMWKIGNSTAAMRAELREEVASMKAALREEVASIRTALREQITKTDFDRILNDERLENLQDTLKLSFNGFEERFKHFSTRVRGEIKELDDRTEDLEGYLMKEMKFEKR